MIPVRFQGRRINEQVRHERGGRVRRGRAVVTRSRGVARRRAVRRGTREVSGGRGVAGCRLLS